MLLLARRWTALAGTLSTHTTAVAAQQRTSILLQLNLGRPGISTCTGNATNVGSHMSDNDPEALRHHKEMSLKGQTPVFVPQAEGWNETLASVSEAVVKAEQMVEDDAATQPAKLEVLQKHTIEVVQQLHHTGEEGMPGLPKRDQHDVSSRPAHKANLEHTAKNSPGSDPR